MLTAFDDYLIHQTPEPVAHPGTGDRNFYDRHFFNGFSREGDLFFGAALGLYPNRRVMDAAFTLVRDGRQLSVHASRLAPAERGETRVGPIAIEVVEALRTLRVRVAPNDFGLEADLLFRARGPALEEPRFTARVENRLFMDTTRLTQFGLWEGTITAGSVLRLGDGAVEPVAAVAHRVRWQPGTRRAAAAEIILTPHRGGRLEISLEPLLTAQMCGLGYLHPEWGHGMWKGELAVGGESWPLADLDPMEPRHLHVQQVCRARLGERQGIGVLEQLVLGPHLPSGFTSILDPAA